MKTNSSRFPGFSIWLRLQKLSGSKERKKAYRQVWKQTQWLFICLNLQNYRVCKFQTRYAVKYKENAWIFQKNFPL